MHHLAPTNEHTAVWCQEEAGHFTSLRPFTLLYQMPLDFPGGVPWAQECGVTHERSEDRHSCRVPGCAGGLQPAPPAPTSHHLHKPAAALDFKEVSGKILESKSTSTKVPLKTAPPFWTLQLGNALLSLCAYSCGTDMCHAWLPPSLPPEAGRRCQLMR